MVNKIILFILFVLHSIILNGQNLVPNSSFEYITSCPSNLSQPDSDQVSKAIPWRKATTSTPDLFNSCGTGGTMAPNTVFGYQLPHAGKGLIGLYTRGDSAWSTNWREYITAPLISPLIGGVKYYASMYISPTVYYPGFSLSDKIGICFTVGPPDSNGVNISLLPYQPQIENPTGNVITDTLNWTKICGSFIASGGEDYITIGNFSDDAHTVGTSCYFFIDDVELSRGDICSEFEGLELPNVFTPNNDGLNDIFTPISFIGIEKATLKIFNRWGVEIFSTVDVQSGWNGYFKDNICPEGVYFWSVQYTTISNKSQIVNGFLTIIK